MFQQKVPAESTQTFKSTNVEKPSNFNFSINAIVVENVISGWVSIIFEIILIANVFKEQLIYADIMANMLDNPNCILNIVEDNDF